MKLNAAQKLKVEDQLGVTAIGDEHPVNGTLRDAFGDHTFFLDAAGLNIVEPVATDQSNSGNVVKLASWTSDERTELVGHDAETLAVTVDLSVD